MVHCHRIWCREILTSLLSNACNFSDKASPRIEVGYVEPFEIHIRPGCPPGSASNTIFYVADNGIGIGEKHLESIFQVFKRLHTHQQYAGTGIGLAVCRRVVEHHGGKLWASSVPGNGSTFTFTISESR